MSEKLQPIPDWQKQRFDLLLRAAMNGDLAAVSGFDRETEKPVTLLCAVSELEDGSVSFVPLGELAISDNPYEKYRITDEEEEEE